MKRNTARREQFTPPELAPHKQVYKITRIAPTNGVHTPRTPNTDTIRAIREVPHYRLKSYTFSPRTFFHQFLCWHLHIATLLKSYTSFCHRVQRMKNMYSRGIVRAAMQRCKILHLNDHKIKEKKKEKRNENITNNA